MVANIVFVVENNGHIFEGEPPRPFRAVASLRCALIVWDWCLVVAKYSFMWDIAYSFLGQAAADIPRHCYNILKKSFTDFFREALDVLIYFAFLLGSLIMMPETA